MNQLFESCTGSVTGTHDADRKGMCRWCSRKVEAAVPMPHVPVSDLTEAYEYFYDPDWGKP